MRAWWLAASLFGLASQAQAHPHSWIDMLSELEINERQELVALRLSWLFDEFYSANIIEEMKRQPEPLQSQFRAFTDQTRRSLASQHYLTRMTLDGQPVAFGTVTEFRVSKQDYQIRLDYRLPLASPQPLAGHQLAFAIYDATYYVEMLHREARAIRLTGPGAKACQHRLIAPTPPEDLLAYAQSLDQSEQAENGLGKAFAERVIVTCGREL